MLSKHWIVLLITALAPVLWGSTYLTTTMFLPEGRPLLAATLRALPAGLLLLFIGRELPRGEWWWKSWVLGILNIGAFFALLFVAAYRLPGGVAAVVGGVQPLIVALFASRMLQERLTLRITISGVLGVFGVMLVALQSQARLDLTGVLAAVGGATSMALGIVLSKKWGQPAPALTVTAWQLIAGGLALFVMMLLFEGLPAEALSPVNVSGYAYLSLFGTAFAYVVWFRGIGRLPASTVAFLGLLSPVVALLLGSLFAGETLTALQVLGVSLVLGSVAAVILAKRTRSPRRIWPAQYP